MSGVEFDQVYLSFFMQFLKIIYFKQCHTNFITSATSYAVIFWAPPHIWFRQLAKKDLCLVSGGNKTLKLK